MSLKALIALCLTLQSYIVNALEAKYIDDDHYVKVMFRHQCTNTWECCGVKDPARANKVVATEHVDHSQAGKAPPVIQFACKDLDIASDQRPGAVEIRRGFFLLGLNDDKVSISEINEFQYRKAENPREVLKYVGERGFLLGPSGIRDSLRGGAEYFPDWARPLLNIDRRRINLVAGNDMAMNFELNPTAASWARDLLGHAASNFLPENQQSTGHGYLSPLKRVRTQYSRTSEGRRTYRERFIRPDGRVEERDIICADLPRAGTSSVAELPEWNPEDEDILKSLNDAMIDWDMPESSFGGSQSGRP